MRRSSIRRPVEWQGATSTAVSSISDGVVVSQWIVTPSYLNATYNSPTLMRTVGNIWLGVSTIFNAFASIGLIIWPGEAGGDTLPVGIAENPDPANPALEWLWLGFGAGGIDTGGFSTGPRAVHFPVSSKGMRKIPTGHGVMFAIKPIGANVNLYLQLRCLIKE